MKKRIVSYILSLFILLTIMPTFAFANRDFTEVFHIEPEWTQSDIQRIYKILSTQDQAFSALFDMDKMKAAHGAYKARDFGEAQKVDSASLLKHANKTGSLDLSVLKYREALTRSSKNSSLYDEKILGLKHKIFIDISKHTFDGSPFSLTKEEVFLPDSEVTVNVMKGNVVHKTLTNTPTDFGKLDMGESEIWYEKDGELKKYTYVVTFKNIGQRINVSLIFRGGEENEAGDEYTLGLEIYQIANSGITLEVLGEEELTQDVKASFTAKNGSEEKTVAFKFTTDGKKFIVLRMTGKNDHHLQLDKWLARLTNDYPIKIEGETTSDAKRVVALETAGGTKTFEILQSGDYKKGWLIQLKPVGMDTVQLDANGGRFSDGSASKFIPIKDGKLLNPNSVETPLKTGYDFKGWYLSTDAAQSLIKQSGFKGKSDFVKDQVYRAFYEKKSYDISFDAKGGTPVPANQIVKHGEKALKPTEDPKKPEHRFNYWSEDGRTPFDFLNTPITKALHLVAVYEKETPTPPSPKPTPGPIYLGPVYPVKDQYLYRWYMEGDQGKFRPKDGITRAEVAQVLARALEYDGYKPEVKSGMYPDVNSKAWYHQAVSTTTQAGVFEGYEDGKFYPERKIKVSELIATLKRFQELKDVDGNSFNVKEDHWAREEVEAAYRAGWLNHYTLGYETFDLNRVIKRGEVAAISNRAFKRPVDKNYIQGQLANLKSFKDIDKNAWDYYEIILSANTFVVEEDIWTNHAKKDRGPIDAIKDIVFEKNQEDLRQVKFQQTPRY